MNLSFIIPVFHGEHTVQPLFEAIQRACNVYNYKFEVVFIWDCGPDKSWESILNLKSEFLEKVKAIRLSRNFGQHNAIICGFAHASGEFMVTMDEDLQHNPDDIKLLIAKQAEKDYEVVYGYYPDPKHKWFRNVTSKILRKILVKGIPGLHKDYSAYRLIKRDLALATLEMQNSYTFLDGYISWLTDNIGSVKVNHNSRLEGESSYTMKKLISHSLNIFVTFSDIPIKIVIYLSLLFFVFTFGYAFYILLQKLFFNNLIPGYASMTVLIGFGIGSVLFGISVIGEYIHRINIKTTPQAQLQNITDFMKNVLAIIGAGILGQHIAHYAKFEGKFTSIVFFDDTMKIGSENNYGKVKGKISDIDECIKADEIQNLLIGIGYKHMGIRKKLYEQFVLSVSFPNIIHPTCYIDPSTQIGNANIFLPGCIVDKGCTLGNNNFFNPGCIIAHDNSIKDHTFFGPGVKTSGFVRIGSCCFFGTGTNMTDNITIGDDINTGAGTLITKSISDAGTYIGIPGRPIK